MKTTLLILLFFPIMLSAQVGIGTANPQATLHVAGNDSTIRIESLSSTNSPIYNDGIKPSNSFVTANGDITLTPSPINGTGPGGIVSPINFLLTSQNFIPDGPNKYGSIINNTETETVKSGIIATIPFTSPSSALIEVKYGITAILSKTNLNTALTPFSDVSARTFKIFFCIDLNSDGLDAAESSKKYGLNAQAYTSAAQGILGYSYTNGHGYTSIPGGTHSLLFFVETVDGLSKYTSAGFGGEKDFLRIRIYN